jgi:hypothetical protein
MDQLQQLYNRRRAVRLLRGTTPPLPVALRFDAVDAAISWCRTDPGVYPANSATPPRRRCAHIRRQALG